MNKSTDALDPAAAPVVQRMSLCKSVKLWTNHLAQKVIPIERRLTRGQNLLIKGLKETNIPFDIEERDDKITYHPVVRIRFEKNPTEETETIEVADTQSGLQAADIESYLTVDEADRETNSQRISSDDVNDKSVASPAVAAKGDGQQLKSHLDSEEVFTEEEDKDSGVAVGWSDKEADERSSNDSIGPNLLDTNHEFKLVYGGNLTGETLAADLYFPEITDYDLDKLLALEAWHSGDDFPWDKTSDELDLEENYWDNYLEFECPSIDSTALYNDFESFESEEELQWDYNYLNLEDNSMGEITGISGVHSSAVAANEDKQQLNLSTAEEADRRHDYEKSTPEEDSRCSQKSSNKGTDEMSGISWFKTKGPDFAAKMGWTQPTVDNKEDKMAEPKQIDDNASPAVAAKGEQQSKFDLEYESLWDDPYYDNYYMDPCLESVLSNAKPSNDDSPAVAAKGVNQLMSKSTDEDMNGRYIPQDIIPTEQDSSNKGNHQKSGISWFRAKGPEFASKMGWSQPIVDNKPDTKAAPDQTDEEVTPNPSNGTTFVAVIAFTLIYYVMTTLIIGW